MNELSTPKESESRSSEFRFLVKKTICRTGSIERRMRGRQMVEINRSMQGSLAKETSRLVEMVNCDRVERRDSVLPVSTTLIGGL